MVRSIRKPGFNLTQENRVSNEKGQKSPGLPGKEHSFSNLKMSDPTGKTTSLAYSRTELGFRQETRQDELLFSAVRNSKNELQTHGA